jgi:hypothetical protein
MDLDISARSSLTAQLLDPVTGLSGSEDVRLNFGGFATVPNAGVVCLVWAPATGKVLSIDLSASLDVTTSGGALLKLDQLQIHEGGAWVQSADRYEIVLVADPLAVDAYGNPISASRASELIVTVKNSSDVSQGVSTLAVTTENQVAILRRASRLLPGVQVMDQISISGVTANACKLYILFGGTAAA